MKASAIPMLSLLLLGLVAPVGWAQDKPKTEERPSGEAQTTPVKVLIVFTEYEGDKKVKSLPYTLYVNAPNASEQKPGWTRLRIGNRVPVYTGNNSFSYVDVGTNIDARGAYTGDGRFLLNLNLERSSVEGDVTVPMQKLRRQTRILIQERSASRSFTHSNRNSTSRCEKAKRLKAPWQPTR